jgi:hypothetical protein
MMNLIRPLAPAVAIVLAVVSPAAAQRVVDDELTRRIAGAFMFGMHDDVTVYADGVPDAWRERLPQAASFEIVGAVIGSTGSIYYARSHLPVDSARAEMHAVLAAEGWTPPAERFRGLVRQDFVEATASTFCNDRLQSSLMVALHERAGTTEATVVGMPVAMSPCQQQDAGGIMTSPLPRALPRLTAPSGAARTGECTVYSFGGEASLDIALGSTPAALLEHYETQLGAAGFRRAAARAAMASTWDGAAEDGSPLRLTIAVIETADAMPPCYRVQLFTRPGAP